jgi:hypothetical protein
MKRLLDKSCQVITEDQRNGCLMLLQVVINAAVITAAVITGPLFDSQRNETAA